MAKRRMFSLDVVDTDRFLDLPLSAQALFFHLGMRADDDGFVSIAKKTAAICGASCEDLETLVTQGYLFRFPSGVYVLIDWGQCNKVKSDRYTPTVYKQEYSQLCIGSDKKYYLETAGIHSVSKLDTQGRQGEERPEEHSEVEGKRDKREIKKGQGFLEGSMGETSKIDNLTKNTEFVPLSEEEVSARREKYLDALSRISAS